MKERSGLRASRARICQITVVLVGARLCTEENYSPGDSLPFQPKRSKFEIKVAAIASFARSPAHGNASRLYNTHSERKRERGRERNRRGGKESAIGGGDGDEERKFQMQRSKNSFQNPQIPKSKNTIQMQHLKWARAFRGTYEVSKQLPGFTRYLKLLISFVHVYRRRTVTGQDVGQLGELPVRRELLRYTGFARGRSLNVSLDNAKVQADGGRGRRLDPH